MEDEDEKKRRLSSKQQMALELLTCGKGLKYKEVAEQVGIDMKTLWRWRNEPEFAHFQERLQQLNDERWFATVDAARQGAYELCMDNNQRMIEFVLKNEGFNPTQKIEADLHTDIVINIEE